MTLPKPPDHLSLASQAWWSQVVAEYEFTVSDLRLLALSAEAWDRCQQAREILERDGLVTESAHGGLRTHPAVAIERDSRLAFARLLRQLALDLDPPAPVEADRPPALRTIKGGTR